MEFELDDDSERFWKFAENCEAIQLDIDLCIESVQTSPAPSNASFQEPRKFEKQDLEKILRDTVKKITEDECHANIGPDLLSNTFTEMLPDIAGSLFKETEKLTHKYLTKKRNAQKFYATYFAKIVLKMRHLSREYLTASSTLLTADLIIVHFKSLDPVADEEPVKMKENEVYGLQYIAGYVLHRLSNRLMEKRGEKEVILATQSCQGSAEAFQDAKLISAVNRGGLWCPSEESMKIFKAVELKFRRLVRAHRTTIDTDQFVQELLNDIDIWSIFLGILKECGEKISQANKETSLRMILGLFIKVRIHSFARQKTEEAKEKARENSKKALRKTLKRLESETSTSKSPEDA